MNGKQELNERTNPVFNTAKSTMMNLCIAGDEDARLLAESLGIDAESLASGKEREVAFGVDLTVMVETRYRTANKIISTRKEKTVIDLPCGYTPRAMNELIRDKHYIGCDLPAVADELSQAVGEILTVHGIKDKEIHGVDATNYRSLRNALNSVEGEICITTEGLVPYLNNSELTELCSNIRRLLEEFGGCWVTADPDGNPLYMAAMKAVYGEAAFQNLLNTKDVFANKSDTNIEVNNMTVLAYDYESTIKNVMNFMHSVGLKSERVPVSDYLPELNSLANYSDEVKSAYKKSLEDVYIWIFTPDENYKEVETNYDSEGFGVTIKTHGGMMKIKMNGRLDSITAPELLSVYEKTAAEEKPKKIIIDASELDYISSAGLRVLLIMIKQVGDGNLTVTGQNETVQTIFNQQLLKLFSIKQNLPA